MRPPVSEAARTPGLAISPIAYPLDEFYLHAGKPLPKIEAVAGEDVPEPYKTLLVHNNDMTPTLEKFYGSSIHLSVLRRQQRNDFYSREVVLLLDSSGCPVEFGAIRINLALFPSAARRKILEEKTPLGQILHEHQILHTSRPKAFLRIEADEFIKSALQAKEGGILYGRRNTLADPEQRPIAEIVEILPPAAAAEPAGKQL